MSNWHPSGCRSFVLLTLLAVTACGDGGPAARESRRPASTTAEAPASESGRAAPPSSAVVAVPAPPPAIVARPPTAARQSLARQTRARLVRGTVEIGLESQKYLAAESFLVGLEGTRARYETVTNRRGEYVFEGIPDGAYTLVVLAGKDRVVHRQAVQIPPGDTVVTIPHIHLAVDSLRAGARRY